MPTLKAIINDIMDTIGRDPTAAGYCDIEPHIWQTSGATLIERHGDALLAAEDLAPDAREIIESRLNLMTCRRPDPTACVTVEERATHAGLRRRVAAARAAATTKQAVILVMGCEQRSYATGAMLLRAA